MAADDNGLRRSAGRTIAFMRLAAIELRRIAERDPDLAIELRRIAERDPDLAGELRRIADQLDADADDLERTARPGGP
ncbi:MAG: hypothetical protein E6G69_09270 [Alphaproteobacteria bacterium]|nr:MAG: hypothetical protein E6G69_09270 [Alphaproteobacteria bacterium]